MSNNKIKPINLATIKDTSVETKPSSPILFSISLTKLYILSVITLGLYDLYWFYKNWLGIKNSDSRKISPFWRAFFSILWAFSLFKEILQYSKKVGYKESYSAALLATIYIALLVAGNMMGRIPDYTLSSNASYPIYFSIGVLLLTVLTPLALLPVQKAINYNNSRIEGAIIPSKHTTGGILLIIIGLIFFLLAIFGLVASIPNNNNAPTNTSTISTEANEEKAKYDSLTSQYTTCSTALEAKLATVDRTSQSAIDQYNAEFQECENIRLQQNASADKYNALVGQ